MNLNTPRVKILFSVAMLSLLIVNIATWPSLFENSSAISSSFELDKPFLTEKRAFISLTNTSAADENGTNASPNNNTDYTIKALINLGDKLSNNYTFANIPDGLGAVEVEN